MEKSSKSAVETQEKRAALGSVVVMPMLADRVHEALAMTAIL
jgi:hypothetical protein